MKIDNLEHRLDASGIPPSQQLPAKTLNVGSTAPKFGGTASSGLEVTSNALLREGRELLLLFVSADCSPCKELLSDLLLWRRANNPGDKLVIISSGSAESNKAKLGALAGVDALFQTDREINDLFGVVATPSALRIRADGRIATPVAIGKDQIMGLASSAAASHETAAKLPGIAYP